MNPRWAKFSGSTKAKAFASLAAMLMLFNHGSQAGQFIWPEDVDSNLHPYSGAVSKRAKADLDVTPKARPVKRAPVPLPPVRDTEDEDDAQSAGGICPTCIAGRGHAPNQVARVPGKKIARAPKHPRGENGKLTEKELCYTNVIYETAKARTRRIYGNRDHSKGACAFAVRNHLGSTGVYDGRMLGEAAVDYSASGKMEALGFSNRLSEFPTPDKAPKGAVLVFAGPTSDEWITHRTKKYGPCHINKNGKKVCEAGRWAGHITIAGENVGRHRWYYTDGRTPQPAVGWPANQTRRRLVGVMIMNRCTGACKAALRIKCEGK